MTALLDPIRALLSLVPVKLAILASRISTWFRRARQTALRFLHLLGLFLWISLGGIQAAVLFSLPPTPGPDLSWVLQEARKHTWGLDCILAMFRGNPLFARGPQLEGGSNDVFLPDGKHPSSSLLPPPASCLLPLPPPALNPSASSATRFELCLRGQGAALPSRRAFASCLVAIHPTSFPSTPLQLGRRRPKLCFEMDAFSSASSDLSAASSTAAGATKQQPTYTTVGSIYNPKAAAPLQPPTRRPRTRRYPQPICSPSDGVLLPFPESLLSALPLQDEPPPSPPNTAAVLQQYCPLQQNDDRAVGPVPEAPDMAFSDYAMAVPNGPAPPSLPPPAAFDANDASDSVASEDALRSRITVKGITSLASYPNPVQKAAQNTLARARAADLDLSRPESPSSIPSSTSELFKDHGGGQHAMAAIPGPPRPLMAGPPGQRPFKSSTLDFSSRSLRTEVQPPLGAGLHHSRLPMGLTGSFNPDAGTPFEDDSGPTSLGRSTPLPREERHHGPVSSTVSELPGTGRLSTQANFDGAAPPPTVTARKVYDTLPSERIKQYYPNGFPSNYDGKYTPISEDWHTGYPIADAPLGYDRSVEREAKTNRIFYSGIQGWPWNTGQAVPVRLPHSSENNVGVIGGEREQLRGSHMDRLGGDKKVQPRQWSLEEVEGMDEVDVAEPLVQMAVSRLMSYKEQPDCKSTEKPLPSGFIKADDAWLETSDEGSSSYFSKISEENTKKKKAARKPRRGY